MGKWNLVRDTAEYHKAILCSEGAYQIELVLGVEALSGSTLKGSRRRNYKRYMASKDALLENMADAGIDYSIERIHRRHTLVFGAPDPPT